MLEHQVSTPEARFPGLFAPSSSPRKRIGAKPRMVAIRALTKRQLDAIRVAMRHRVDEDLARGRSLAERRYCDACERACAAPGFVSYNRYLLCNTCATEFEVANARGLPVSAGQFVRDINFGETGRYALDAIFDT
jgi:hypothetical protein